ncbi:MAG: hypothetical protein JWP02_161 [Acidimicrobiales bacterium]|nr:hypothetical protein [Acidimicrobiales bacterium]
MLVLALASALLAVGAPDGRAATGPPLTALRFGVYPGNTFSFGKYVGAGGTNPVAYDGDLAVRRMVELANGRPFDVHLYMQWNRPNPPDVDPLVARLTAAGLTVNLALKYVPPAGSDGDLAGFAAWVADVVRAHPTVGVFQITNEANVPGSPDTDGSAKDPVGALLAGVNAAATARQAGQLVGFNWFYRLDPVHDTGFWSDLGTRGGEQFRRSVDFAGVDIYAGTYIPPLYSVDDESDFRTALDYVRNQMMPLAGLGAAVPIFVQETGYPTLGPLRSEAKQADALRAYIRATRGFGVGLLQWFQLADATSPLGDGWGVLRADYSPKPAFVAMRDAGTPVG